MVERENSERFRDTDLYGGVRDWSVCQKTCEPIEESTGD